MSTIAAKEFTTLLHEFREGKEGAGSRLMSLVYQELRRLAAHYMRQERLDHTLQATALVHEVYIQLCGSDPIDFRNRAHFFAVAAQQMRRILVDHARARHAGRRGGRQIKLSLDDVQELGRAHDVDMIALDEALSRLKELDLRASQVVELRFFAGMTEEEIAQVVGIATATVKRDWNFAKAWLFSQLGPPSACNDLKVKGKASP